MGYLMDNKSNEETLVEALRDAIRELKRAANNLGYNEEEPISLAVISKGEAALALTEPASDIKKEIEAAAIAAIKCPSCGAEPGEPCHRTGSWIGSARKWPTHQRRLSGFVSEKVSFK